jgi:ubiquinone/menaquinone biosynthesis C-methylase UbiE
MNIHTVYGVFQRWFRPRRIRRLRLELPILDDPKARILDVGGTPAWWHDVRPAARDISIVNLDDLLREPTERAGYRFFVADARQLPFANQEFDLAHSNSVIEHVGDFSDQQRFASELLRCGRRVYVQTPNHWFPVEPHLIALFIHWLPFRVERRLVRWFSVWGLVNRPTQAQVDAFLADIRLLRAREIDQLFPGLARADEKFLGLTKSFVVIKAEVAD